MKSDYRNCIKVKSILLPIFIMCTNNNFAAENIANRSYNPIEHENDYCQQQDSAYRGRGHNYRGRGHNYRGRGYYNRGRGYYNRCRHNVMNELEISMDGKDNSIEKVENKSSIHIKSKAEFSCGDNKGINKNIKEDLLPIKTDMGSSTHRSNSSSSSGSSSSFDDFKEHNDLKKRRLLYYYPQDSRHSLLFTTAEKYKEDIILAKHGLKFCLFSARDLGLLRNEYLSGFRIAVNTKNLFSFLSEKVINDKIGSIDRRDFYVSVIDYILPVKKDKKEVLLYFINDFIMYDEDTDEVETALYIDNKMHSFGTTKTNEDKFWVKDNSCKDNDSEGEEFFKSDIPFLLSATERHTVIAISYRCCRNDLYPSEYEDHYSKKVGVSIFNIIPLERGSKKFYEWAKRKHFKMRDLKKLDSWFFPNDVRKKDIKIDPWGIFSDNKKQGKGFHKNNIKGEVQNSEIQQKKENKKIEKKNKKVVRVIKNFKEKDEDMKGEELDSYEEDEKDEDVKKEEKKKDKKQKNNMNMNGVEMNGGVQQNINDDDDENFSIFSNNNVNNNENNNQNGEDAAPAPMPFK